MDVVVVKINNVGGLVLLLLSVSFPFHLQKAHIVFVFCFASSVQFNTHLSWSLTL